MTHTPLISSQEALTLILEAMPEVSSESVQLMACRGRVLFEDVVAPEDVPRHANSSMDGFAVLHSATASAASDNPLRLHIAGESAAGRPFEDAWDPANETIRIMTGAIVPEGANAVVELELAAESSDTVALAAPVPRGRNIRLAGEDVRRGETVLSKGLILEPEHIGLLASLGCDDVGVARKPSVMVITTGSELVDPRAVPAPGMVRNSSLFMIPSYIEEAGGQVVQAVSVGDDEASLSSTLQTAWDADIVITTGGISVGKYDLVRTTLEKLGVDIRFAGVNIKPGKPLAFGVAPNGTPIFCLPGNPVSTAVTFWRFVRPAFDRMMGRRSRQMPHCRALLEEEIEKKDEKEHFLRGIYTAGDGMPTVRRTGTQSSGVLSSMAKANCLIMLPAERRTFEAGESVEIQLL